MKFLLLTFLFSVILATPVCIFDIDHTLTRGASAVESTCGVSKFPSDPKEGTYAAQAVKSCLSKGYNVAIATAELSKNAIANESFLTEVSSSFNDAFFKSAAFQYGHIDKRISLRKILSYYGSTPSCTILFDDASVNGVAAKDLNVLWQEASTTCKGNQSCNGACGLTKSEFEKGIALLEKSCNEKVYLK